MKKIFALFLVSVSVFADEAVLEKEDVNLQKLVMKSYTSGVSGQEEALAEIVATYKRGDLQRLERSIFFPIDLRYTHEYNDAGKIVKRVELSGDAPSRCWIYSYHVNGGWEMNCYGYDDEGERNDDPHYAEERSADGKLLSDEWMLTGHEVVHAYFYDESGRLVKMEETPSGADEPIAWAVYKYADADDPSAVGKLETKESYSGGVLRGRTIYNDQGEEAEAIHYDGLGESEISKSIYSYKYKDFGFGERKTEEVVNVYIKKNEKWAKTSSWRVELDYVYKK